MDFKQETVLPEPQTQHIKPQMQHIPLLCIFTLSIPEISSSTGNTTQSPLPADLGAHLEWQGPRWLKAISEGILCCCKQASLHNAHKQKLLAKKTPECGKPWYRHEGALGDLSLIILQTFMSTSSGVEDTVMLTLGKALGVYVLHMTSLLSDSHPLPISPAGSWRQRNKD